MIVTLLLKLTVSLLLLCCATSYKTIGKWSYKLKMNSQLHERQAKEVGVVVLAGGSGKRMKSAVPKQFLPILGKTILSRSINIFQTSPLSELVTSIVVVLDKEYREQYSNIVKEDPRIQFADPGKERQDSVYNGVSKIPESCKIVAVHDAARPLVTVDEVLRCIEDGLQHGAAVLGVPMKATVKESADGQFVLRTIPRERLWEIHTPQVVLRELLIQGFEKMHQEQLAVTDDVSLIEALNLPVKITKGEYTNIKITTPDDMKIAEQILLERENQRK